jgi:hypothetical protein
MSMSDKYMEKKRKRTGDVDDASLWPRQQQIELAIMCLSGWLSGLNDERRARKLESKYMNESVRLVK